MPHQFVSARAAPLLVLSDAENTTLPHENISSSEANAFYSAIEAVLRSLGYQDLKDLRLFRRYNEAIVVSFEPDWQPFLNSSFGWHKGHQPKPTWPIKSHCHVLDVARTWLMNFGDQQAGGRVFINSERIARRRAGSQESLLGILTWEGEEPVAAIGRVLQAAVQTLVDEAVRAAVVATNKASDLKALHGDHAAEELYAEAMEHLQRVAPDVPCGPQWFFDWFRKTADEAVAARVPAAIGKCESICLLAQRTLRQGDQGMADIYWALARVCLSEVGQEDQFDRVNAAAAGTLESELADERRKSLLSAFPSTRVIKQR